MCHEAAVPGPRYGGRGCAIEGPIETLPAMLSTPATINSHPGHLQNMYSKKYFPKTCNTALSSKYIQRARLVKAES